jgi:hypothetical protein
MPWHPARPLGVSSRPISTRVAISRHQPKRHGRFEVAEHRDDFLEHTSPFLYLQRIETPYLSSEKPGDTDGIGGQVADWHHDAVPHGSTQADFTLPNLISIKTCRSKTNGQTGYASILGQTSMD